MVLSRKNLHRHKERSGGSIAGKEVHRTVAGRPHSRLPGLPPVDSACAMRPAGQSRVVLLAHLHGCDSGSPLVQAADSCLRWTGSLGCSGSWLRPRLCRGTREGPASTSLPGPWSSCAPRRLETRSVTLYSSQQIRVHKAAACLTVVVSRVRHHMPSKHAHPLSLKDSEQIGFSPCPFWSTHLENHFSRRRSYRPHWLVLLVAATRNAWAGRAFHLPLASPRETASGAGSGRIAENKIRVSCNPASRSTLISFAVPDSILFGFELTVCITVRVST